MIRTMLHLWKADPGFRPQNVLTFGVSLPPSMMHVNPEAIRAAVRDLDAKIAATPGVEAVSETWGAVPLASDDEQLFWLQGQPQPATQNEMNWTIDYIVGPDYLKVMSIPLQRGRFFTAQDDEHSPFVVVVDDIFARKFFGDVNPIGKRVVMNNFRSVRVANGSNGVAEIIGVVGHVNQWGLDSDATQSLRAELYMACAQMPDEFVRLVPSGISVMARFSGAPFSAVFDSIRHTAQEMSSDEVVYAPQSMEQIIAHSIGARRFSMVLLGSFAGLAVLLSSIGIYGVISYLVGQRTQEIGIRIALGADRREVLRLVLSHGGKMAGGGVLIGLGASLALTRLMAGLLYGVSPTDPLTFAGVAAVLTVVALAACYIPARRATKVDPVVALRYQ